MICGDLKNETSRPRGLDVVGVLVQVPGNSKSFADDFEERRLPVGAFLDELGDGSDLRVFEVEFCRDDEEASDVEKNEGDVKTAVPIASASVGTICGRRRRAILEEAFHFLALIEGSSASAKLNELLFDSLQGFFSDALEGA